ncbi:MAG: hypothetical protein GY859_14555, partial [Desulfobacterales bacterium]|nr:hypothetical protein [Desulfobacterales bacterium]
MWVVLGNPENRRVAFFKKALKKFHQPEPVVLSWLDFLERGELPARVLSGPAVFRLESPGENHDVEKALLAEGEEEPDDTGEPPRISRKRLNRLPADPGRILYPRQWWLGFRKVLRRLDRQLSRHPE